MTVACDAGETTGEFEYNATRICIFSHSCLRVAAHTSSFNPKPVVVRDVFSTLFLIRIDYVEIVIPD